jgi:glycosyltransferase involved in cell wall biosynthesis
MRILALVNSMDHVCCRYRLAAFDSTFREQGHTFELRPWPQTWVSRLLVKQYLGLADVLIIQRKFPPYWQMPLLKRVAGSLIFDFDDAVFCRDSFSAHGVNCTTRTARFRFTAQNVDYVVAGNSFLSDAARLWIDAARVVTIPTCVDLRRYSPAGHQPGRRPLTLAWIGTSSTLRGMERMRPMLEDVGRSCPNLVLKIICDRFLTFTHLDTLPCRWSEATEARELASADIGLSWLPDDLWSQGKCGLKVLQYMAAGLPVLANPVGLHSQLVRHGENGFLVENQEELIHAIELLRGDPDLRRQMGQAGRELVAEHYSIDRGAAHWIALLDSIAREQNRTPINQPGDNAILVAE